MGETRSKKINQPKQTLSIKKSRVKAAPSKPVKDVNQNKSVKGGRKVAVIKKQLQPDPYKLDDLDDNDGESGKENRPLKVKSAKIKKPPTLVSSFRQPRRSKTSSQQESFINRSILLPLPPPINNSPSLLKGQPIVVVSSTNFRSPQTGNITFQSTPGPITANPHISSTPVVVADKPRPVADVELFAYEDPPVVIDSSPDKQLGGRAELKSIASSSSHSLSGDNSDLSKRVRNKSVSEDDYNSWLNDFNKQIELYESHNLTVLEESNHE